MRMSGGDLIKRKKVHAKLRNSFIQNVTDCFKATIAPWASKRAGRSHCRIGSADSEFVTFSDFTAFLLPTKPKTPCRIRFSRVNICRSCAFYYR